MIHSEEPQRKNMTIVDTGVVHDRLFTFLKEVGSARKRISDIDRILADLEDKILITDIGLEASMLDAETLRRATSISGF